MWYAWALEALHLLLLLHSRKFDSKTFNRIITKDNPARLPFQGDENLLIIFLAKYFMKHSGLKTLTAWKRCQSAMQSQIINKKVIVLNVVVFQYNWQVQLQELKNISVGSLRGMRNLGSSRVVKRFHEKGFFAFMAEFKRKKAVWIGIKKFYKKTGMPCLS